MKSKGSNRRKIINSRTEIRKIENNKQERKAMKPKAASLRKPVALRTSRHSDQGEKRETTQIHRTRNELSNEFTKEPRFSARPGQPSPHAPWAPRGSEQHPRLTNGLGAARVKYVSLGP